MSFINICEPTVKSPGTGCPRVGRGFSRDELTQAGLSVAEARRIGLIVDLRRRTSYPENVESINRFIEDIKEMIDSMASEEPLTEDQRQHSIEELTSISSVKPEDAQLLVRAGIRSLSELAYCDIPKIAKKTGIEESRLTEMAKAALKKV